MKMAHYKPYDKDYRAQRRIQGEDVFGNKIKVTAPAIRHLSGRKVKSCDISYQAQQNYAQERVIPRRQYQNANNFSFAENSCLFRPIRGAGASNNSLPMEVGNNDANWGGGDHYVGRRSLTPQDLLNFGSSNLPSHLHKHGDNLNYTDDGKMIYKNDLDTKNSQPVNLIISNLDPSIEVKELKGLLTNMIEKYAMILRLNIMVQPDGTPLANFQVKSQQEAQFTISQLHRHKLGHKRIIISYAQSSSPDPEHLRAMAIEILQEVPDKCMALFQFIDLLESRYHCTVSVSEVNKLKDICRITDDLGSRIISLTREFKTSPPPNLSKTILPYCTIHSSSGTLGRGWCELNVCQMPNVMISLKQFAVKLTALMEVHMGCMPLLSFQSCYEQECKEPLPVDDSGVPLEHLISCVPNLEIKYVGPNTNIKVVRYETKINNESEEDAVLKSVPLPLAPSVSLLCRELVDLLKTMDKCQLLLSRFIPAYHHHFGRQCRVADYGYTKLLDLFESISHVVQVMGDGTRRVITLSHSAQMRRFTSDLLRVLKVQPSKQLLITGFPAAYEKVMSKPFGPVEYGLCTFEDLLQEVPENTVVFNRTEEGVVIAVPKREQTMEEIIRTKQFASEVIGLLRHSPYYTMLFNKFVPAYHHHFGLQCKVSDYGFTKLIELFEAIPDIVKIEELGDGERTVSLTLQEAFKVLGTQIVQLIKSSKSSVVLHDLPRLYLWEYGYPLKPQLYECSSIEEVATKLSDYVQVIESDAGPLLITVNVDTMPNILKLRVWALLLKPPHCKELDSVRFEYQARYNSSFTLESLQQIKNVILISSMNDINFISLSALYVLAAQLYHVIYKNGGSVLFSNLEKLYCDSYGKALNLSNYHIHSVDDFYNYFSLMFFIRSNKKKTVVMLNKNLAEHLVPLPPAMYKLQQNNPGEKKEALNWPPPPVLPEKVQNPVKKVSPPKPDTPPSPNSIPWNHWNVASSDNSLNLSIQMPIEHNPKLLCNTDFLISPARQLWPLSKNPWQSMLSTIPAPDPAELPMPDQLIPKGGGSDDSADSGVNVTGKAENSPPDNESGELYGERKKLTFATFLNFNK